MSEGKSIKLIKVAKECSVGIPTIVDFLKKKGIEIDSNPNTKISEDAYSLIFKEYSTDSNLKKESKELSQKNKERKETIALEDRDVVIKEPAQEQEDTLFIKDLSGSLTNDINLKILGKIDVDSLKKNIEPKLEPKASKEEENTNKTKAKADVKEPLIDSEKKEEIVEEVKPVEEVKKGEEAPKKKTPVKEVENIPTAKVELDEIKVLGKIDLDSINQKVRPAKKSKKEKDDERKEKKSSKKTSGKKSLKTEVENIEPKEIVLQEKEIEQTPVLETEVVVEVESVEIPGKKEADVFHTKIEKLTGPTVLGRIDLPVKEEKKPLTLTPASAESKDLKKKKKRKRIKKERETVVTVDRVPEEKLELKKKARR